VQLARMNEAPRLAIQASIDKPAPAPTGSHGALPAWPGWLVAGIGLAGVGAGIGNLVLDGKGTCKTTVEGEQCPQIYTTGNQGIGFLVAGAAVTIAGITWGAVMTARRKHR